MEDLGRVQDSVFWPAWNVQGNDGAIIRVEPDVYIEFESLDLIVEVKLTDDPGCQAAEQWAREWAVWYQGAHAESGNPGLFLATGGLGSSDGAVDAAGTEIKAAANRLLETEFIDMPPIQCAVVSWEQLFRRISSEPVGDLLNSQLAHDLAEILRYFGLRRWLPLNDLLELTRQANMRDISVDSLEAVARWRVIQHEQNWFESSRKFRPISILSIAAFSRAKSMNHDDLSQALIAVRKAYRLLYLFQRRVLDVVEEISTKLGHDFYYWLPSGDEEAVRGGANPCDRSAWKMLPLFDANFLYLPPGVKSTDTPRKGQWLLEIIVCPDDGEPEGGKGESNPLEFGDPAKCSSKI